MSVLLSTITPPLSLENIERLTPYFDEVYSYPDNQVPKEVIKKTNVYYCIKRGLPEGVKSFDEFENIKLIQLSCAGASDLIENPAFAELANGDVKKDIVVSNASGLHANCVCPYAVATTLTLYHRLHEQIINAQVHSKWVDDLPDRYGNRYYVRSLRNKTVGILGYGHLGRECARLFKAFGCKIIAANTSGRRTKDKGYIIPGTGDLDCELPEQMYSTTDSQSLKELCEKTDILISSLPSTKETTNLLNSELLGSLKKNGTFINIGRGNVIKIEELMKALDSETNPLFGAAVDVTDPEPLPDGHPLYKHPRCIVTPHLSGEAEAEFDLATDILIENVKRIKDNKSILNQVDLIKGY